MKKEQVIITLYLSTESDIDPLYAVFLYNTKEFLGYYLKSELENQKDFLEIIGE